jgi:hypothetical protein
VREFIIHKKDNRWINTKGLNSFLESLNDGRYKVQVSKTNKRSNPQNDYLHGVLIPEFRRALISVGYEVQTEEHAKMLMKAKFLKTTIANADGEYLETIKDTRDLTKEEMSNLFEEVIRFCAENMNYIIPYPNEQMQLNYD